MKNQLHGRNHYSTYSMTQLMVGTIEYYPRLTDFNTTDQKTEKKKLRNEMKGPED